MFPEGKPVSGKRLVPQLAVGCVLFAILGLIGTFAIANLMKPFFQGKAEEMARKAQMREKSRGR
ncbi:hypothetical protein EON82_16430 [bacterium]|nr:MAG: hypothetical protein EON82_16430 [bacterium]